MPFNPPTRSHTQSHGQCKVTAMTSRPIRAYLDGYWVGMGVGVMTSRCIGLKKSGLRTEYRYVLVTVLKFICFLFFRRTFELRSAVEGINLIFAPLVFATSNGFDFDVGRCPPSFFYYLFWLCFFRITIYKQVCIGMSLSFLSFVHMLTLSILFIHTRRRHANGTVDYSSRNNG